jgi:thiosulfate/3-mercaptopyruvate sulfurtransferase
MAGVDLSKPMVFTCGDGLMATIGRNAAEKAGATGERAVYDGSWAEYSMRRKESSLIVPNKYSTNGPSFAK